MVCGVALLFPNSSSTALNSVSRVQRLRNVKPRAPVFSSVLIVTTFVSQLSALMRASTAVATASDDTKEAPESVVMEAETAEPVKAVTSNRQ